MKLFNDAQYLVNMQPDLTEQEQLQEETVVNVILDNVDT